MRVRSFWIRLITTFCFSCSVHALPAQDLTNLPKSVEQFLKRQLENPQIVRTEISVNRPDPRLRLQQCDKELTLKNKSRNSNASHMTVQVSCESGSPWSFYVSAQVKQWTTILSASRDLYKGQTIKRSDLSLTEHEISRLGGGFIRDHQNIEGMTVKRSIAKGSPIREAALTTPLMVNKGDQVTIIASNGAVSVKIAGTALSQGKYGDQIRVENSHSKRIIKARISAKGTVSVLM